MRELTESEFYHETAINQLEDAFVENDWIIIYSNETWDNELVDGCSMFRLRRCYLVDPRLEDKYASHFDFDIEEYEKCSYINSNEFKASVKEGIEQLFTRREFNTFYGYKYQIRLNDDFVHIFHLYERWNDIEGIEKDFVSFSDGNEDIVVKVRKNEIRIKHTFLISFLCYKKMNLVCALREEQGFDPTYKAGIQYQVRQEKVVKLDIALLYKSTFEVVGFQRQNILIGKRILRHESFSKFVDAISPRYAEFIVGYDSQQCEPIYLSCATKDAADDYRLIFFEKKVVERYRTMSCAKIEAFSIETDDFFLRCDNDSPDYIIVYLKDLGSLPYSEQQHWKIYNVVPQRNHFSTAFTKRLTGYWGPLDYASIDFVFRERIIQLNSLWLKKFGWELLKPPTNAQRNIFYQVIVLQINEYGQLADLIQKMNLLLTDSINVKELNKAPIVYNDDDKSIQRLSKFIEFQNLTSAKFVEFLSCLNRLRSYFTNTHRHNSNYVDKNFMKATAYINIELSVPNFQNASVILFQKANDAFEEIINVLSH